MNTDIKINSSLFDHTNLKQDATEKDILKLCSDAVKYNFHAVCLNPYHVVSAKEFLSQSDIKIVTVIGFPLGANITDIKLQEALLAAKDGADELDMVANIGMLKEHRYTEVENEISNIRKNIPYNIVLKVIVESSQLTDIEIVEATKLVVNSGADYIKTSTGFLGFASVNAVSIMFENAKRQIGVKASGGIKTVSDCHKLVSAGATRLGCSASVNIITVLNEENI